MIDQRFVERSDVQARVFFASGSPAAGNPDMVPDIQSSGWGYSPQVDTNSSAFVAKHRAIPSRMNFRSDFFLLAGIHCVEKNLYAWLGKYLQVFHVTSSVFAIW